MPLQTFAGPQYLRCDRIFVNTNERDLEQSRSKFDMLIHLDQLYEKVVSMELVSWNMPYDIAPTIFAESLLNRANNLLDVEIEDVPSVIGSQAYTVALQEGGYKTVEDMGRDITRQLNNTMDNIDGLYVPHDDIVTGPRAGAETVWHFSSSNGKLTFFVDKSGVPNSMSAKFLFTTGPSAGSTPAVTLGFTTEADTLVFTSPLILGPTSTFPVILSPLRFVDVFVDEVDEFNPMIRIPLSGDLYSTERWNTNSFRLLTKPIRNTQEIHVRLEMVGGLAPESVSTNGFDLIFDVLLLSPEITVPTWVNQTLAY
jgi:hypothetical protein